MNQTEIKNISNNSGHVGSSKVAACAVSALALCLLSACGGGGSSDSTAAPIGTSPAAPTAPATPVAPGPVGTAPTAPDATAPNPTTSAGDCSEDGSVVTTAGNTGQVDGNVYNTDGTTIIATQQRKFATSSGAIFRDKSNLFLINQVNITTASNAAVNGSLAGSTITATENNYSAVVGDTRQTYGLTISTLFNGATTAVTSYFTPYASTGGPVNPALDTTYTANFSTTTQVGNATQAPLSQTSKTTFSAESVTVLAGTFPTCKTKVEVTGGATVANVSFAWRVASGRYKGLVVRTADGRGVKTSEATRLVVNGQ